MKVTSFKDLEFTKQIHGGLGSSTVINGHTLSVQCGSFVCSTPRENLSSPDLFSSFEVAIWKNDESNSWVTDKFFNCQDAISGWTSKDEITEAIKKLKKKKS
tara:strand:+ start:27 stop:332 length:306 start_codon:yes stop_codon:yes gene_type:complete